MSNFEYIAGFMDGEGTVTLSYSYNNIWRNPVVSLSNNVRSILEYIQECIGVNGCIITKSSDDPSRDVSYELRYVNNAAIAVCANLKDHIRHPTKKARMELITSEYKTVTPRNGKYSEDMKEKKRLFESRFFSL